MIWFDSFSTVISTNYIQSLASICTTSVYKYLTTNLHAEQEQIKLFYQTLGAFLANWIRFRILTKQHGEAKL